jgi:hypothetical protein
MQNSVHDDPEFWALPESEAFEFEAEDSDEMLRWDDDALDVDTCPLGAEVSDEGDSISDGASLSYPHGVPSETPSPDLSHKLVFRGADELGELMGEAARHIARYVFPQSITEIVGAVKAAGKTTFLTHLCRAILEGQDFLGEPTQPSPILYLSEQTRATFREALRRADLIGHPDFRYLLFGTTLGVPWPKVVAAARAEARRIGAKMLCVDTLGQWARLKGDAENSAGAALEAMAPLQAAAAEDGLAIVIVRHERKSGGDVEKSARGSSAFAGAVDVIVRMRRPEGAQRATLRILEAISRFDGVPELLAIELTDAGYVVRGDGEAISTQDALFIVAKHIPSDPLHAVTEPAIVAAAGVSRTVVRDVVKRCLALGWLGRLGEGKRGDPYRYFRQGREAVSDGTAQGLGPSALAAPASETLRVLPSPGVVASLDPPPSGRDAAMTDDVPYGCGQPAACAQLGPCPHFRAEGQCWADISWKEAMA